MKIISQIFMAIHVALYRLTNGKIGGSIGGSKILLLTTIGRKSGKNRTTPVTYTQDGENYIITASAAGAPRNPGWYWNMIDGTNPVKIQVQDQKNIVSVIETQGEERDHYYENFKQVMARFADYEQKTSRVIPVLKLTPQT